MTKWVTVKENGRKRRVPISEVKKGYEKSVDSRQLVRISHPGSLTKFGYSLKEPRIDQDKALLKAIAHYGKNAVIDKLTGLKVLFKNQKHYESEVDGDLRFVREQK